MNLLKMSLAEGDELVEVWGILAPIATERGFNPKAKLLKYLDIMFGKIQILLHIENLQTLGFLTYTPADWSKGKFCNCVT